jgi:putative membrane protein insertion efficiency factor
MTAATDHAHDVDPPLGQLPLTPGNLPRWPVLALIRLYQLTFSRLVPQGSCRFYPTCSHYGYQAIYRHGIFKGGWLATWRVLRCQPFSRGGYDPVP